MIQGLYDMKPSKLEVYWVKVKSELAAGRYINQPALNYQYYTTGIRQIPKKKVKNKNFLERNTEKKSFYLFK